MEGAPLSRGKWPRKQVDLAVTGINVHSCGPSCALGFKQHCQQPGLRLDPPSAVCQPPGRLVLPPPPGCSSANSSRSDRRAAHFPPPSSPTASLPGRTVGNIYAPKTPWVRAFATTSVGYISPPPPTAASVGLLSSPLPGRYVSISTHPCHQTCEAAKGLRCHTTCTPIPSSLTEDTKLPGQRSRTFWLTAFLAA